jgi:two-component system sensor kinase FixL
MPDENAAVDWSVVPRGGDGQPSEYFKKMYERASRLGRIGVWECDLATEALTWTDTVYDLFDLPRQSLLSRAETLAVYEPHSRREMEKRRAEAIANCSTFTIDVAIHTARGNLRWIRITGDVEQENGRAVRIYGTKQDITAEKEAQLRVAALQSELIHQSRVSAIDAMRSTLAHELNQPLAAITFYAAALQNVVKADSVDRKATVEIIEEIGKCTSRAASILRDARNLSAIEQREPTIFDLASAVREACQIALAGGSTNLKLFYDVPEDLHGIGDPIQIQQVVINLIRNACEAMVGSEREEITIAATEKNGFAEVSICDSGGGIPADMLPTIFDAFVTTKANGTGIGLSIGRTIIEAHSGKLTAQNNAAGGATFRFTVPSNGASIIRANYFHTHTNAPLVKAPAQ